MKNTIIFIFIFCCLISSCYRPMFKLGNYEIPDSLLTHFLEPEQKCSEIRYTTSADKIDPKYEPYTLDVMELVIIYEGKPKVIRNIINEAKQNSLFTVQAKDTSYLIIEDTEILSKVLKVEEDKIGSLYQNYYSPLICNFDYLNNNIGEDIGKSFYDPSTLSNLSPEWTICVLKSGNQYVMNPKYKFDFDVLPPRYQHGYSSGIAFNEKEEDNPYLICWVAAW